MASAPFPPPPPQARINDVFVCFETLLVTHWQEEQMVMMQRMLQEGIMTATVFDIIRILYYLYINYIYICIWLSRNAERTNNLTWFNVQEYIHLKRLQAQAMMVHHGDQMMVMAQGNVHAQTSKYRSLNA
jgi:hypothetical protein